MNWYILLVRFKVQVVKLMKHLKYVFTYGSKNFM